MVLLECPNCGARNVAEFRYGGELKPRPAQPMDGSEESWVDFVFMKQNRLGVQAEWWYHRAGCGIWFMAQRHTKSNQVLKTYRWQPPEK